MNKNTTTDCPCGGGANDMGRRRFLERLTVGLGVVMGGMMAIPGLGFVLGPLFRQDPRIWRKVGKATDFKIGETSSVTLLDSSPLPWAGVTAKTAAWLRRVGEEEFIAFSVNCSHLGCPVRWMQDAGLFMCPCHGGVYYQDGSVAAGPPPKPLTRYSVRVRDGFVEVMTEPIPVA